MVQKTHGRGSDVRYFWHVTVQGEGAGMYRSRCSTKAGVLKQFARQGKRTTSIRPVKA